MFWTKAIPTERMNAEQIKRRFEVVEAPDSAIFLASAMNILATGLGYKISADQNTSVLGDGRPIPMMSYGVVEYLLGLDLARPRAARAGRRRLDPILGEPREIGAHLRDEPGLASGRQIEPVAQRRGPAIGDRYARTGCDRPWPDIRHRGHRLGGQPLSACEERASRCCGRAASSFWTIRTGSRTPRACCARRTSFRSTSMTSGPCIITAARRPCFCIANFARSPERRGSPSRRSAARMWPGRINGTARNEEGGRPNGLPP